MKFGIFKKSENWVKRLASKILEKFWDLRNVLKTDNEVVRCTSGNKFHRDILLGIQVDKNEAEPL